MSYSPNANITIIIDTYTLSAPDIMNKGVILSKIPADVTKVNVAVGSAPTQTYLGLDYAINSNLALNKTLDWTGLGLDGVLTIGDNLIVTYY
jgi:hypothetical protein